MSNRAKRVKIVIDTQISYWYGKDEVYDAKQAHAALKWEVIERENKGKEIWKGHSSVIDSLLTGE